MQYEKYGNNDRERHWFTTFWLYLSCINNISFWTILLFSLPYIMQEHEDAPMFFIIPIISTIVLAIAIIGIILLLHWKKIGFSIYIICVIIELLIQCVEYVSTINIFLVDLPISMGTGLLIYFLHYIGRIITIPVFYKVLHLQKNSKNTLEQLE